MSMVLDALTGLVRSYLRKPPDRLSSEISTYLCLSRIYKDRQSRSTPTGSRVRRRNVVRHAFVTEHEKWCSSSASPDTGKEPRL